MGRLQVNCSTSGSGPFFSNGCVTSFIWEDDAMVVCSVAAYHGNMSPPLNIWEEGENVPCPDLVLVLALSIAVGRRAVVAPLPSVNPEQGLEHFGMSACHLL